MNEEDAARFAFIEVNKINCRFLENGYWEATGEELPWVSRKTLAECIDVLMNEVPRI